MLNKDTDAAGEQEAGEHGNNDVDLQKGKNNYQNGRCERDP